jgi:glycosyltransferase involved in cell wall biosynthesis
MKIVFICLKGMPDGGGIEKYTEALGSRLVQRGHTVIVYCSRSYGTEPGLYKGMHIRTLPTINTRSLQTLSLALNSTLHQFLEPDVDIVHFHAVGPSVFCFLPRLGGRKTLVQSHGHEWMQAKWGPLARGFFHLAEYAAVYLPNRLTAVSKQLKSYYATRYGIEVDYVPTGVEIRPAVSPRLIEGLGLRGQDYILFLARLVREKGAHYLLEAYAQLQTDVRLVIAGSALHEETYKAVLENVAGTHPNILFVGYVTGALREELYSNARLFVLPSEVEGLPMSLLEAMSYALPCLASNIPENMEALGDCGYTFKNKDIDDLRRCMEQILVQPEASRKRAESARTRVQQKYSWDAMVARYERIYETVLEG